MTREEYINTLELDNAELKKENKELKSQLAGTTHCFDEEEHRELKKQLEAGEQQYNDLVEEKEKLDAENQVLKNYKNVALTYMKNYLKMELNYRNKDVAEHFKVVIDMLNRGNKHGNLVDIIDCDTQQKEFINYLQKEINSYTSHIEAIDSVCSSIYSSDYDNSKVKLAIYKEILQKYKEIVNGSKQK